MNLENKGKRITLIFTDDPYTRLKPGDKGTIVGEDDMKQIQVNWDSGSTLSMIPGVDKYEIEE